MTKFELFVELAKPNKKGISRWVSTSEFIGKYKDLKLGNGGSWCRKEGALARVYEIKKDKSVSKGPAINRIKLNGFNPDASLSQHIRLDIKNKIKKQNCVILGTSNPEVDYKNGRKNDERVMNSKTQKLSDFQALSKAANNAKRQFCKECKIKGLRFDAKKLYYSVSFIFGSKKYTTQVGCKGCYWFDPREFKSKLFKK